MVTKKPKEPLDYVSGDMPDDKKQRKILLIGPRGQYKTRLMLWMCDVPKNQPAILSVIDTENGTDEYRKEFNFRFKPTSDPDEIQDYLAAITKKPGNLKVSAMDSHTVYFDAIKSKYADLYLKRMPTSSGHKGEFYIFQPNDHEPYRREVYNEIRNLIKSGLHLIWTCHSKDKWKGMKVIGETANAIKSVEHYFSTVLRIEEKANNVYVMKVEKDRTNTLPENQTYKWRNEKEAREILLPFKEYITGIKETTPTKKTEKSEVTKGLSAKEIKDLESVNSDKAQDETSSPKPTLMDIVTLKKELLIRDNKVWNSLIKPYGVKTAKDMSDKQITEFVEELKAMRPTKAQAF